AVVQEEPTTSAVSPAPPGEQQEVTEAAVPAAAPVPPGGGGSVDIREIKLIEDNGQQGLFVKLSRPPVAVTHYTLAQRTRVVIDSAGGEGAGEIRPQKSGVKNPLSAEGRVTRHEEKIRVTLELRGGTVPTYTVNDLNDTVVAFVGEPTGGTQPVHEQ